MTIKILNQRLNLSTNNNVVLFSDADSNIKGLNSSIIRKYQSLIIKSIRLNKLNIKDFYSLDLNPNLRVTIVKISDDVKSSDYNEKLGAKFFKYINSNSIYKSSLLESNAKFFIQKKSSFID